MKAPDSRPSSRTVFSWFITVHHSRTGTEKVRRVSICGPRRPSARRKNMSEPSDRPIGSSMAWLNYHHLFYFWTTVREGSVSAASRKLRLAQATVSEQLKSLEESLGVELFNRVGSKPVLTEMGSHAYRYADEIFTLGRELQDSLQGLPTRRAARLVVGIADVVPKLVASRLL